MHSYDEHIKYNGRKIIECKECGFKHIYPIPSKSELDNFYKNDYYREVKPFNYDIVTEEYITKK